MDDHAKYVCINICIQFAADAAVIVIHKADLIVDAQ